MLDDLDENMWMSLGVWTCLHTCVNPSVSLAGSWWTWNYLQSCVRGRIFCNAKEWIRYCLFSMVDQGVILSHLLGPPTCPVMWAPWCEEVRNWWNLGTKDSIWSDIMSHVYTHQYKVHVERILKTWNPIKCAPMFKRVIFKSIYFLVELFKGFIHWYHDRGHSYFLTNS